jgi:ABC-2 type transport system permease protein
MSYALTDSATMLRRNLLHAKRYPGLTLMMLGMPVILLLLFVFVLGDALAAGIGGADKSAGDYINFLTPGIIIMTIAAGTTQTAISVCSDMTEGIIARFRTMAISRTSVLTGHVVGSIIQSVITVALLIGVALVVGFRPNADAVDWLGAVGLLLLLSFGLTWIGVAMGLVSKSVEGASNLPMPIMYLPFLSSAFVPPESMSDGVRWFAEYQPFTPIIDTLRGLLLGTASGGDGPLAIAWCLVLALVGYAWARSRYTRPMTASRPA